MSVTARANPDAPALVRALGDAPGATLPQSLLLPDRSRLPVIGRFDAGLDGRALGFVPVAPGFGVRSVTPEELLSLAETPGTSITWAPPRHLLLDQATAWTHADRFRNRAGQSGAGTVIGIVDSGIDGEHADLLDAAGRTRVAWLLDFSRLPAGIHPELEAEYGCHDVGCAIYQGSDLDRGVPSEPLDTLGHGTHVASLAAGNGRSDSPPRYVGMAPEAKLISVRVARPGGEAISDADLLLGVRFVFDRALELGMPAVVNLSLGSDFGAHDGTSPIEQALASLVGPEHPGRALVVAAGNGGALHSGAGSGYPEPLGIHTEVHVPRDSSVRVPILSPPIEAASTRATVYVWIGTRAEDEVAVGFERDGATLLPLVPPRSARSHGDGELTVTVLNRVSEYVGMPVGQRGAVVVIDGSWQTGSVFSLRLEGHATANLWLQSEGDLAPERGSLGAVFPRAIAQGTINVPGTHPALIAVGATLDRTGWTDRTGQLVELSGLSSYALPADSVVDFSAAGPTAAGLIKPDLVAPGAFVIGAMAGAADPAKNGAQGAFAGSSACPGHSACLVVDDHHAVLVGTSMAAPLVSGAIALMFAQDPQLTQDRLQSLLQAGARRPSGIASVQQRIGPGALDLERTLDVIERERVPGGETLPTRAESWLTVSDAYARPDPGWPLAAALSLRSAGGQIADGFAPGRLSVALSTGTIAAPLTREAPGFWRFSFACPRDSGGETLGVTVTFDGAPLLEHRLPVAVDPSVAAQGWMAEGGRCTAGPTTPARARTSLALLVSALVAKKRRRRLRR